MDKRIIRDYIKTFWAIVFSPIYLPHIFLYLICPTITRHIIKSDLNNLKRQININLKFIWTLIYFLHNNSYYRSLFYYRIGPVKSLLVSWYRPCNRYFIFSNTTKIDTGFYFAHPYGTIINADSIGKNFKCIQLTTIGKSKNLRPIIGNDVECGANVTIIGGIKIGNNVTIGAGSVVVKDVPNDCVIAGNPAKIIKYKNPQTN